MSKKYVLGVDFGSLSARAVLFQVTDGSYVGSADHSYRHGIIEEYHPITGGQLPPASALQIPDDYLEALQNSIRGVLQKTGIDKKDIIAMALDFTSCSLVALDKNYEPMCKKEEFKNSRHSYVKMWKQHTAVKEAQEITEKCGEESERFGGKIMSEWGIPKILETLREEPELYNATYRFMEAGDWLTTLLTGEESMSYCSAGLKFMWLPERGYPSREFFKMLDTRMENVEDKLVNHERILPLDSCAGYLTEQGSELTGLPIGIPVAPMRIDGHSSVVALMCHVEGRLDMILGTSMGLILTNKNKKTFPGLCGVCDGAVVPGLYGYETGLSSCGDIFQWFADQCIPAAYEKEAQQARLPVLAYVSQKIAALKPGESGLIALDWWNGNRSVLEDEELSGMILGLNLQTKPEEILMALFEATGYGARTIIEAHRNAGIDINEIVAVGGIAEKNPVFVQIFADIIGCPIYVPEVKNACALGTAIYASLAAGKARGGYDHVSDAVEAMGCKKYTEFHPIEQNQMIYEKLYREYRELHDYFGRGGNDVMKRLLQYRKEAQQK